MITAALSGVIASWKSSFTMQTGPKPHDARHSANSIENLPSLLTAIGWWWSVWERSMPACSQSFSINSALPAMAQESVRQTRM